MIDNQEHYSRNKHTDFASACTKSAPKRVGFHNVFRKFQQAKHAEQTEYANHQQIVAARHEDTQVRGNDGE